MSRQRTRRRTIHEYLIVYLPAQRAQPCQTHTHLQQVAAVYQLTKERE